MEKSQFLEFKSFVGHVRRIVLASTETKVGMQQLVKRIASIIGALVFEPRIPIDEENRTYTTSLSTISPENIAVVEDATNQTITRSLSSLQSQPRQSFLLKDKPSREEIFRASLASLASTKGLVLETDDELLQSWKWFTNDYIETVVLDSEGPLHWHSKAIDLAVRYFDFLFKV